MISWYTLGLGPVYNFVILCLVSLNEENDISSEFSVETPHNCPIGQDPIIYQLNLCYLIMLKAFSITNLYLPTANHSLEGKKNVFLLTFLWLCNRSPWFSSSWRWRRVAGCSGPRDEQKYHLENKFSVLPLIFLPFFSFLSFLCLVCERE